MRLGDAQHVVAPYGEAGPIRAQYVEVPPTARASFAAEADRHAVFAFAPAAG